MPPETRPPWLATNDRGGGHVVSCRFSIVESPPESPVSTEDLDATTEELDAAAEEPDGDVADLGDDVEDLGGDPDGVSSPEDRARLLADAVVQSETQEAKYRLRLPPTDPPGRWKSLFAMVTFMLAGVVAVGPPAWLQADPPATVTEGERVRGVRAALFLQAQQVEAYRVQNQRLPRSLNQLPIRVPGVRFVRSNNQVYQLVAFTPDGKRIVYDSTRPSEFDPVAVGWFTDGDE